MGLRNKLKARFKRIRKSMAANELSPAQGIVLALENVASVIDELVDRLGPKEERVETIKTIEGSIQAIFQELAEIRSALEIKSELKTDDPQDQFPTDRH